MPITQRERIRLDTLIDALRHADAAVAYVQAGLSKRHLEVVEKERLKAAQRLESALDRLMGV